MARKNQDPKIGAAIKKRNSEIPCNGPCKRSFNTFATPLSKQYLPKPNKEWEPTLGDIFANGGDPTMIMSHICQLTNDIHPIFRDDNLCTCPEVINMPEDPDETFAYCMAPHFADESRLVGIVKERQIDPLLAKNNAIIRTIFQLATQMATHEDTLPFWAGITDFKDNSGFIVHPRRRLNQARKERTLQHLQDFASHV